MCIRDSHRQEHERVREGRRIQPPTETGAVEERDESAAQQRDERVLDHLFEGNGERDELFEFLEHAGRRVRRWV